MNVTLELIDAASGAAIATDEVRIETLPERFEGLDTHLTVGDAQYSVVGADPSSRDDIAKAGRVRLLLSRVEQVDPRTILFSVPTLEDSAAPIDPAGDHAGAIAIHEDDWRQIELLSAAQREAVDAELSDIRAVKSAHHKGHGYEKLHVRRRVPAPLDGVTLPLKEVVEAMGAQPRALSIRGVGVVRDGFALPLGDALVYGTAPGGAVAQLCIHGVPDDVVGLLHAIARKHHLVLVEWCAARVLRAHDAGFVA